MTGRAGRPEIKILEFKAEIHAGGCRLHLHRLDPSGSRAKVTKASALSSRSCRRARKVPLVCRYTSRRTSRVQVKVARWHRVVARANPDTSKSPWPGWR